MHYLEHSTSENATNDTLQEIHDMVEHVKQDAEVSLEYMKIYEKEQMLIEEGIELGRQEAERQFEAERHKFLKQQQLAEDEHQRLLEQQRQTEKEHQRLLEQQEDEIHKLRKALAELSSVSTSKQS